MKNTIIGNRDRKVSVFRSEKDEIPLILTSPHSGQLFTKNFLKKNKSRVDRYLLTHDMYVDDIIQGLENLGLTILQSEISRVVIDLNRHKYEIDPSSINDFPSDINFKITSKAKSGIGIIPLLDLFGNKIYEKDLGWDEMSLRLKHFYLPWHETLSGLINEMHRKYGFVFVIDCHSMPSTYNKRKELADFVIGNLNYKSCFRPTIDIFSKNIVSQGYNVAINNPYSGGFITENYYDLKRNIQTIQIEIRRDLYMDEKKNIKNRNYKELKRKFGNIIRKFSEYVYDKIDKQVAAE